MRRTSSPSTLVFSALTAGICSSLTSHALNSLIIVINVQTNRITSAIALSALHNTPVITSALQTINFVTQEWSASDALHFQAIHHATQTPVLIKVGITSNELFWSEEIFHHAPHLVPVLFLSGRTLGDLDLAWKVVEIAQGGVLGPKWGGREFEMLLAAGVEFQRIAQDIHPQPDRVTLNTRTSRDVKKWLMDALPDEPPGPVQVLIERVDEQFDWVEKNCETVTCHGDLHMCNGVTRTEPPNGSVLLIDFATCRQPWAFEAARLQVLNSIDKDRVGFRNLVQLMASLRQVQGLSACVDLDLLSKVTLAWFAAVMWHLVPERRTLPGYREIMRQYIEDGAQA